jgi:ACS family hexuronate transporter-like MFS transporter
MTRYRWRIVALLFFATSINYIDRQIIGLLKPYIIEDLGWGENAEALYGYVISAFQMAYALGLLFSGWLLDKFGTKIGYSIAVTVWSLAGILHAAARSAFGFGAARFALGLGEAANFPAAVKSVAEWFPKKERAFATGIFNSGSNIGAIIAPIVVAAITVAYGWRWAFIITGAFGFVWLIFWLIYFRRPVVGKGVSQAEVDYINSDVEEPVVQEGQAVKWKDLFRRRSTYAIVASRFVTDWVWWFFLFWVPDFLNKTYGVDIKDSVLPLIIIYTVAGFGGIAGGWLSSNFIKRNRSIDFARKTSILICALCVVPIIFIMNTSNIWVAVGLISLAAAAHQGWASNIYTVVSDIYPKNAVGSMTGLAGFAGSMGGVLASAGVGLILQATGSYLLIFTMAGSAYLIAWLILKLMIKRIG